jgi:hypothetical protein
MINGVLAAASLNDDSINILCIGWTLNGEYLNTLTLGMLGPLLVVWAFVALV